MKFKKILFVFIFYLSCPFIYAQDSTIPEIVSSTFLTQDLSKPSPEIEVLTSEEIKALGVTNIPELLKLVNSLNIYSLNESTAEISLRGYPSIYKLTPLILIDGMEISENIYDRTYLYNLPIEIQDIDRIEILKNTSITVNGILNNCGVINIVTKAPESLDSNFLYSEIGSQSYKKLSGSFNHYYKGIYFKLNGFSRRIAQNDIDFKMIDSSLIGFEMNKYFSKSRLFFKSTLMKEDLNFMERFGIRKENLKSGYLVQFHNSLKNIKHFNNFLNFKSSNFDASFYYQTYFGKVFLRIPNNVGSFYTNNRYYKFTLRKKINFENNELLTGIEGRYRYAYLQSFGNMKRFSGNIFFQDNLNLFKNFDINFYLNFDKTKNFGNKISYKLSFIYNSSDKSTYFRIGLSKDFKKPFMGYQYFNYYVLATNKTFPILNKFNIDKIFINYLNNKEISSYKIRTTEFVFSKKIKNLKFDFVYFYNLIYDIPQLVGKFNLFPLNIAIKPIGFNDINTSGFDTKIEFKTGNFKFFADYFYQRIKDKVRNKFIHNIPENKFTSGLIFKNRNFYGSLTSQYVSSYINFKTATDTYTLFNISLTKLFLNGKFETTFNVNNIFNNKHIEGVLGDRIGRTIEIRLKYDF